MTLYEQLESVSGQLSYVTCILMTNLQKWERKEYEALKKDYILQIAGINCAIEFQKQNG